MVYFSNNPHLSHPRKSEERLAKEVRIELTCTPQRAMTHVEALFIPFIFSSFIEFHSGGYFYGS